MSRSVPWILPTLLTAVVGAGVSIAALHPFSPLEAASLSSALPVESVLGNPNTLVGQAIELSNQTTSNRTASNQTAFKQTRPSCHNTHLLLCVYVNRNLVSQLEQGLRTTNPPPAASPELEMNQEVDSPRRPSPAASTLGQTTRLLTQLKTWLDTIS